MESIPKDEIFEFNNDTLQYLRKQYNLDKTGRIDEAINILEEWIKKQSHFVKKEYRKFHQFFLNFLLPCNIVLGIFVWKWISISIQECSF